MTPRTKELPRFPGRAPFGLHSLGSKVIAVTTGSCALVATMLIVDFIIQAKEVIASELRARAQITAIAVSHTLASGMAASNLPRLLVAADAALADVPDLAYVVVRDEGGAPLATAIQQDLTSAGVGPAELPSIGVVPGARTADRMVQLRRLRFLAVEAPVLGEAGGADDHPFLGTVQVGFRFSSLQWKISGLATRSIGLGIGAIALCAVVAFLVARLMTEPVTRLTRAASGIARGDLQQSIASAGTDEISELGRSFELMTTGLKGMISDLKGASEDVETEVGRILSTSSKQTAVASQQAAAINQTRSNANEIARASQTAGGYADSVIQTAQKSEELSVEGQRVVQESVTGIERLGEHVSALSASIESLAERTKKIGEIIGTVKEVAEMSHVLSLNLSIQAAHAGANRHGFDVVATEMRKLAALSGVAATEVRQIVVEIQRSMQDALVAAREGSRSAADTVWLSQMAGRTISGLADVIRQSSRSAREIADHARRQTSGIEQILTAISEQSQAMEQAVHGSEQVEDVAKNLSTLAKKLSGTVTRYGAD